MRPSNKDTPSRAEPGVPDQEGFADQEGFFSDTNFEHTNFEEQFPSTAFEGSNFFNDPDDQSNDSGHPFFKPSGAAGGDAFDPRNYQTESGH